MASQSGSALTQKVQGAAPLVTLLVYRYLIFAGLGLRPRPPRSAATGDLCGIYAMANSGP
ncbi:hypothetical protein XAP412_370141 [Xanthomonas phaseoli pv. phaseoli]|uniref:Uncharacterized protein n=1 Tax=Xanthomonas campestris pv. phaseoli TaxID=317013 RepID=A0AB38E233_XANCH|nr:hypothetical protein XAP6984_420191 [Xanthomonas phaseoli pv. phaseoli]SON84743.1 hypothetical protein XAP412_370141 [Xanthomonas phaseoli pv. phaseoli]SON89151.1 hypothetical protein XAP7430_400209 [Xanthomonas phaseoli pv. phaseoli]